MSGRKTSKAVIDTWNTDRLIRISRSRTLRYTSTIEQRIVSLTRKTVR